MLSDAVLAEMFSCLDASTAKVNDIILSELEFCQVAIMEEAENICKEMLIITEKQESGDTGGQMRYLGNQRILAAGVPSKLGDRFKNSSQISECLKLSFY